MNIKERRTELRLTQREVAEFLGVHRDTYLKWENNPGTIPLGQYLKLEKEFNRLKEMKYGLDTSDNS